jgi:GNAT superfamily N-acetyltransferase
MRTALRIDAAVRTASGSPFVDPDFRGMGVGRQLVMYALELIPDYNRCE